MKIFNLKVPVDVYDEGITFEDYYISTDGKVPSKYDLLKIIDAKNKEYIVDYDDYQNEHIVAYYNLQKVHMPEWGDGTVGITVDVTIGGYRVPISLSLIDVVHLE